MMRCIILVALGLLAGCESLPRDPEDTQNIIEASGRFSVASADALSLRSEPGIAPLIAELERRTGAKARWEAATGEVALKRLTDGSIDLVIGHFRKGSPWQKEVAFGPPLAVSGAKDDPIELRPAMRNGENRWVVTVERSARAISAQAREQ